LLLTSIAVSLIIMVCLGKPAFLRPRVAIKDLTPPWPVPGAEATLVLSRNVMTMDHLDTAAAPLASAKSAGLRYVNDQQAGITRLKAASGFCYVGSDGKPVRDQAVLARIKALAIPPAWTEVWICADANGHLQATGRDARQRKQYRYHPRWRDARDEVKFERMLSFARALPDIRQRVDTALRLPGLPREKMLATVVCLLEATMMRIGNEEYARENHSFGLTTLCDRHVRIDGSEVQFQFRGKSGVRHAVRIHDRRLARIIRQSRDLPGQELFQYLDDNGRQQSVGSADVNDYLREISGEGYTAKDFRTWSGTVLAALALQQSGPFDSQAQAKANILQAIETVANKLGNTPAICRKCYVHPAVIDSYLDGTLMPILARRTGRTPAPDGSPQAIEQAVLGMLQQRLAT
jgi:DNA topoisomerase I